MDGKLLIDTEPGIRLRHHLFTVKVAVNPQITPLPLRLSEVHAEWRILQVIELLTVRIDLDKRLPLVVAFHKELQVVAVRADHRDGKVYRLIALRPVECRLQHNLFFRIALRFVKSRGRFWLAE